MCRFIQLPLKAKGFSMNYPTKISKRLLPWLLVGSGFGSFSTVQAHPSSDHLARLEFFHLKRTGEWLNYIENQTYVEVVGTKFIGLQAAFNERRSCLFGFSQAGLGDSGRFEVETRFVCFPTGQYELNLKKEWCELGTKGCEIDPGGISVGIGNLNVAEPTGLGEDVPLPKPGTYPAVYPKLLNVDVFKPLRFPFELSEDVNP
jgi:hypothetical protein